MTDTRNDFRITRPRSLVPTPMTLPTKKTPPYAVNIWGSHPNEGNDDWHTGTDFDTLEQAEKEFDEPVREAWTKYTAFVELKGPNGFQRVRPNPGFDPRYVERESAKADREWQNESAMQAGMAFGVDGYNDAMGYDLEPPERDE